MLAVTLAMRCWQDKPFTPVIDVPIYLSLSCKARFSLKAVRLVICG
ncbi:hypothetical protein SAMN05216409_103254 [Pseudomonas lutea]|uniref:Uncharacterized protein n=1 Tax=Pseudomonas lutea TaxID=243924 RepID=A0A9X8MAG1_9PSED|nr:hypothetical protein SAMN05216409_103254 [Pseudomonas lutea]